MTINRLFLIFAALAVVLCFPTPDTRPKPPGPTRGAHVLRLTGLR